MTASAWTIERLAGTDAATADAVIDLLRDYNAPFLGRPAQENFWLVVRGEDGALLGGLLAEFRTHWLHVSILVVAETLRHTGVGSELMRQAEAAARERGCHGIWLDTFEFQAPRFYERLGFRCFGTIDDFYAGYPRYFLEKRL